MKRFLASVHSLTTRKMDIDNHLFHLLRLGLAIDQTAEKYIFTLSIKRTIFNEMANVLDKNCENFYQSTTTYSRSVKKTKMMQVHIQMSKADT